MKHDLENSKINEYKRNGVVHLKNVLNQTMLNELAAGVKLNLAEPTPRAIDYLKNAETGEHFFHDAMLVNKNSHYAKVVFDSPLAESVAKILQSETIAISNITVFIRSAGTQKRTRWHRDQPYWPVKGRQACSTWIPLDPVPLGTSLEFVRGSHQWEDIYARDDFRATSVGGHLTTDNTRKESFPDIEANRDDYEILGWEVEPGDCLLFHGMTTHGGSGNLPIDMGRRTISFQWFGDDVTFSPEEGGVDPDFLDDFRSAGVSPGMPIVSEVCPLVWPH